MVQLIFGREARDGPVPIYWSFTIMVVVVALIGYICQDQRETADARAKMGGELAAAREVQRMLSRKSWTWRPAWRSAPPFCPPARLEETSTAAAL